MMLRQLSHYEFFTGGYFMQSRKVGRIIRETRSHLVHVHLVHVQANGFYVNATSEPFSIENAATLNILDPHQGEDIVKGQPTLIR